ncbi:zinc finger CCCH domain-containing protein 13-like isoform X4 [Salvia hispanica]|uniref:zinc finger CCCH domain-containing protein 13-like isoform X4 n=1 Tax=Salvia hispanica TaxID=49212 RepID=UPI0020097821|nr:zinc finger CCCH domain-containing protein 13-like isoform X4 [Salvia hispanica]
MRAQEYPECVLCTVYILGESGRREDVDLRERLNRNRSPSRKSPDKGKGKARQTSYGDDSSPGKRIDRNVSKKRRLDDHDDYSGRMSDDKMRGTHYDKPKFQLIKEADSLTSEVHELKRKLSKEKEERERFTTNVKKFIEAHYSHLQLENELKRSQDQIKHLVAQLEADILTRRVFSSSEEDDELKKSQGDEGGPDSSSRRLRSRVEVHGKSPQG